MSSEHPRDLAGQYLHAITAHLDRLHDEEGPAIRAAARAVAEQVNQDRLVHLFGPGGHSNLAAQEVFFRAGGLMHVSAILDEGTLLSNGALRSMAIERTPGYGRVVINDAELTGEDLLILVNAYGINAALIDAALAARDRGVRLIGVSSVVHAQSTTSDHPARHPSKANLHDLVDLHVDTKVPVGDAVMAVAGVKERTAAISSFANAYCLQSIMLEAIAVLADNGCAVPVWRSGNAPGGDEANARFLHRFRGRVRQL